MNQLTDYRALLIEAGLPEDAADFIASKRADKRNKVPAGTIRAEKTEDGNAELMLYDVIGFDMWTGGGMTPKLLIEQLESFKPFERLTVRVNSPGGDVFDGMTIFNILRRQEATIAVEIEGIAASAASFIVQAADAGELKISEAGMMMTHRAWGVVIGNTNDMLQMSDVLDKLDGQIATIYANRSKRKVDTWLKIMDEEAWYTGAEAVEAKLADATISAKRVAAFDLSGFGYRNAPQVERGPSPLEAAKEPLANLREMEEQILAAAKTTTARPPNVEARLKVLELDEEAA